MSSGAGIDAATFEQLKATLYKANGGARAIVKTKKRSVRGGGGLGDEGGEDGVVDAASYVCPANPGQALQEETVKQDLDEELVIRLIEALPDDQDITQEVIEKTLDSLELDKSTTVQGGRKNKNKYKGGATLAETINDMGPNKRQAICGLLTFLTLGAAAISKTVRAGIMRTDSPGAEEDVAAPEIAVKQGIIRKLANKTASLLGMGDPQLKQEVVNAAFSELANAEDPNVAKDEVDALNEALNGLNEAAKNLNKNALIGKIQKIITKMAALLTKLKPDAPASAEPAATAGGARRRTTKRKGGALDMNKLYNVQGLIGNSFSKDPMQRAGTVIDDRTPLPFSAGTSGAINQSFISDLNPVLGQMGGARKRVADGRRRKAQRGGAPPLSEDQATKLIGDFLTFYDSYSGGANFAADLEYIHYTTLRFIYIIVMNAFHDLHKIKPISVLRKVIVEIYPKIVKDYVPVTVATLETNTKITETPPPIPTNLTDMFLNIKSVDKVANIASPDFFNVWNYLGNKEGAIDIGWLKVLLEKLIEYLDDEVFIKQLNNYYNIQILKAYNDYSAGECYANCQAIYNACQKYLPFAKALLEQIDILIYKGFYITSYNMTGMKEVISYARAKNAVKQISDIRKTGVIKATNTYTKPPPAGAAGGGRKKRA